MEDRTGYVRVTNNTDLSKPIVGRYAGQDYVFKKGVPVDIPEMVARHVFDFGKDDKTQALNRLGWIQGGDDGMERALERLTQVKFDDPPEMIEAPPKPRGRKPKAEETGTAGPPVIAGGTEGGVFNAPPNGPKIGEEQGEEDETP